MHYLGSDELYAEDFVVTAARVRALAPRRLVITGGEPLLQQPALEALVAELKELTVEVETNGTIAPSPALCDRVAQWNVSPKLSNSGMAEAQRLRPEVLSVLRDTERAWLKLLVVDAGDLAEINQLVTASNWPKDKVILQGGRFHRRGTGSVTDSGPARVIATQFCQLILVGFPWRSICTVRELG